jgi:HYR domain/Secretion system C-terminal sorting domain
MKNKIRGPLSIMLLFSTFLTAQNRVSLVKNIAPSSVSSNPNTFILFKDKLYFVATDTLSKYYGSTNIWETDGTEIGTKKCFKIKLDTTLGVGATQIGLLKNKILVWTNKGRNGDILSYDGAQTTVLDTLPKSFYSIFQSFVPQSCGNVALEFKNHFYYNLRHCPNCGERASTYYYLWRTNGQVGKSDSLGQINMGASNDVFVKDSLNLFKINTSRYSQGINVSKLQSDTFKIIDGFLNFSLGCSYLGLMNGANFITNFQNQAPPYGKHQLIRLDSNGQKKIVVDSLGNTRIESNAMTKNRLFFFKNQQLWRSDGTLIGTKPLIDTAASVRPLNMSNYSTENDTLYFLEKVGLSYDYYLWKIEGDSPPKFMWNFFAPDAKLLTTGGYTFVFMNSTTNSRLDDQEIFQLQNDVAHYLGSVAGALNTDYKSPTYAIYKKHLFLSGSGSLPDLKGFATGYELWKIRLLGNDSLLCPIDTIAPVFKTCPPNQTVKADSTGTGSAWVSWRQLEASDNCEIAELTANVDRIYTRDSGDSLWFKLFLLGTTNIVYTAKDLKGNTSTCRFSITVEATNKTENIGNQSLKMQLRPNYTGESLTIETTSNKIQTITIHIVNAFGHLLKQEKRELLNGDNQINFSVQDLPNGIYFITSDIGNERTVPMKFVKY